MESLFEHREALLLFLLLFIPGFISLKVYDLLIPGERRDFSKALFDAVVYGALNSVVLFPLIGWLGSGHASGLEGYAGAVFLLVVMPSLWPVVFLQARRVPWLAGRITSPNPRVWDDIFARKKPYWVIVHLKDERRIGGLYAEKSFSSHSPAPPEIYLEEVWHLDENGCFTGAMVDATSGILIMGSEILALEFFLVQ